VFARGRPRLPDAELVCVQHGMGHGRQSRRQPTQVGGRVLVLLGRGVGEAEGALGRGMVGECTAFLG
jgi:hypothetical protein